MQHFRLPLHSSDIDKKYMSCNGLLMRPHHRAFFGLVNVHFLAADTASKEPSIFMLICLCIPPAVLSFIVWFELARRNSVNFLLWRDTSRLLMAINSHRSKESRN